MGEWMANMKEGGEVPTVLRPYFQAQEAPQNAPQESIPANVDRSQIQSLDSQHNPHHVHLQTKEWHNHRTIPQMGMYGNVRLLTLSSTNKTARNLKKQYYAKRNSRFKQ